MKKQLNPAQRQRLAAAVNSARLAKGIERLEDFRDVTEVSAKTLGRLENGYPVAWATIRSVGKGLGWTDADLTAVINGEAPLIEPAAPELTLEQVQQTIGDLAEQVQRMSREIAALRAPLAARDSQGLGGKVSESLAHSRL